jgi:hypothetical protein
MIRRAQDVGRQRRRWLLRHRFCLAAEIASHYRCGVASVFALAPRCSYARQLAYWRAPMVDRDAAEPNTWIVSRSSQSGSYRVL